MYASDNVNEQDGFALVSQLNALRDEFLRAKDEFDNKLQAMEIQHKEAIAIRDKKITTLQTRNTVLETRLNECKIKIDDNEQYSRRHTVRIEGLPKKYKESNDDLFDAVYSEINKLGLDIEANDIDRIHRSGVPYNDERGRKQQTTLVKFTSWYYQDQLFEARKRSKFFVKPDLTKRREKLFEYARGKIKNDADVSTTVNYVYVDCNCNLMASTSNGRFFKFNTETEFDMIPLHVHNSSRESETAYGIIESQFQF